MMSTTYRIIIAFAVTIAALAPWQTRPAHAFDTGHHSDLSRIVLKRAGFSPDATGSVLLASWLTDYYSNAPFPANLLLRPALSRLHFDNLRTAREVKNYYAQLMHNLQLLTREAASNNDPTAMLIVLGLGHHVIQDFYAHSNWAELYKRDPNGAFDIDLFPDDSTAFRGRLRTGTWPGSGKFGHGDYTSGLNKDAHVRPGWENAFVMAHVATERITGQLKHWAETTRPGFWGDISSYRLSDDEWQKLQRDLKSASDISMWVKASVLGLSASDGHWKGNLSGHSGKFASANNAFTSRENSNLARRFRQSRIAPRLALNLKKPPSARRQLQSGIADTNEYEGRAIAVKIHAYSLVATNASQLSIGARIRVNGETYLGRIFTRRNNYRDRNYPAWHEIHIEPGEEGADNVTLELFALQKDSFEAEIPLDINPDPERNDLPIAISRKNSLVERIKEELTGYTTGILQTRGDHALSASISYSVDVHEID